MAEREFKLHDRVVCIETGPFYHSRGFIRRIQGKTYHVVLDKTDGTQEMGYFGADSIVPESQYGEVLKSLVLESQYGEILEDENEPQPQKHPKFNVGNKVIYIKPGRLHLKRGEVASIKGQHTYVQFILGSATKVCVCYEGSLMLQSEYDGYAKESQAKFETFVKNSPIHQDVNDKCVNVPLTQAEIYDRTFGSSRADSTKENKSNRPKNYIGEWSDPVLQAMNGAIGTEEQLMAQYYRLKGIEQKKTMPITRVFRSLTRQTRRKKFLSK